MNSVRSSYWKFFNLIGKAVGYVFIGGGLVLAGCFALLLIGRKTDLSAAGVCIAMALICAALGLLLVKAKPSGPINFSSVQPDDGSGPAGAGNDKRL